MVSHARRSERSADDGKRWDSEGSYILFIILRGGGLGEGVCAIFPERRLADFPFLFFLGVFVCLYFLFVFWEALEGPLGALGSIWEPFGEHFGVILVTFSGYGGSLKTYVLLK